MASTGTATIDFGAAPGSNSTTVVVSGQTGILSASSHVEAFMMGMDSTTDHSDYEHMMMTGIIKLTCTAIVDNTSFTITAICYDLQLSGTFKIHWVWV